MQTLILASASPQRKVLLKGLGLVFQVIPSGVQEDRHPEPDPARRARDLARLKALDIASSHPGDVVIGCDTLVVSRNGTLLEKPADAAEATKMIRLQSGRVSTVHSAVCIVDALGKCHEGVSSSLVSFKKLSPADIRWWVTTGLWKGRSGGFQIDGPGQLMIERIEGDWTGVVGLPVFLLGELLRKAKCPLR